MPPAMAKVASLSDIVGDIALEKSANDGKRKQTDEERRCG
jgi:hypothetical protein